MRMHGDDHYPLMGNLGNCGLNTYTRILTLCIPSVPKEWRDYDDLSMHSYPIASSRGRPFVSMSHNLKIWLAKEHSGKG
jgi:hypothetical protein